ncbi:MAG TPA: ATP-dependent metallopeptidase FtsH/Yme1/Tma family protein, partial [Solirubrobacteraceae bacterium]
MSRFFKSAAFPILIVVVLAFFASKFFVSSSPSGPPHTYQTLVSNDIPNHLVKSVDIKQKGNVVEVKLKNKENYEVGYVDQAAPELIKQLKEGKVPFNVENNKSSELLTLLIDIVPFILFFGLWMFIMSQVQGGGSKVMSFGKSRAKRLSADSPKITFRDVAGVDEAVEELHEIKEFLENPKKFQALGA